MKWFSFFRGLIYLKRISESLDTIAKIETERFLSSNPRYRGWEALKPRKAIKDDTKTVIEKPTIEQINKWWREDNEIISMAKQRDGEF